VVMALSRRIRAAVLEIIDRTITLTVRWRGSTRGRGRSERPETWLSMLTIRMNGVLHVTDLLESFASVRPSAG
jgi:hypothetical protein